MRITTDTSLIREPVFPSFTYSGKIELDDKHVSSLVNEINKMQLYTYNWGKSGWNSDPNEIWRLTDKVSKLAPLIVKQLFDVTINQYGFVPDGNTFLANDNRFMLECRRCFPVIIYPGHDLPIQASQAYFTGVTMLSCTNKSHRPYIQNMRANPTFEDQIKWWMPEVKQQIFIPGDVPWGISSGNDDYYTVALVSHILRKRT